MARSKAAIKKAKAAFSRKYRASSKGAAKVLEYNRKTIKERSSRNKARALLAKKGVALKGKDVHHVSSNPMNNAVDNLKIAKAHHEGGAPKGNKNARRRKKK